MLAILADVFPKNASSIVGSAAEAVAANISACSRRTCLRSEPGSGSSFAFTLDLPRALMGASGPVSADAGVLDYLAKPVRKADVLAAVGRWATA